MIGSVSGILLETRYKGDPKAEAFFCRYLLCSNDLLQNRAYEKLTAGGAENLQQAIRLFEQVLDRDKVNPYRWCDLGDALVEAGQAERAQSCFRKALELGPNVPAILMRAANFYLRTDDARSALPQTSHVLKMAPDYDQVVFSSYTRMNLPVSEVLAGGIPEDKRAGQAYLRYLLSNGAGVVDAERGWEWLAERRFTDDALAAAYLDFLASNRRYAMASAVWAKYLGKRRGDYLQPNRLFNGGSSPNSPGRCSIGGSHRWMASRSRAIPPARNPASFACASSSGARPIWTIARWRNQYTRRLGFTDFRRS